MKSLRKQRYSSFELSQTENACSRVQGLSNPVTPGLHKIKKKAPT